MKLFDPPPMKSKSRFQPRLSFPAGINKKLFYIIYFGSLLTWLILFMSVGTIMVYLVFPLMRVHLQMPWAFMIFASLFLMGSYVGLLMATNVVNAVIRYGVEAGDIKVVKPDSGTHNAEI